MAIKTTTGVIKRGGVLCVSENLKLPVHILPLGFLPHPARLHQTFPTCCPQHEELWSHSSGLENPPQLRVQYPISGPTPHIVPSTSLQQLQKCQTQNPSSRKMLAPVCPPNIALASPIYRKNPLTDQCLLQLPDPTYARTSPQLPKPLNAAYTIPLPPTPVANNPRTVPSHLNPPRNLRIRATPRPSRRLPPRRQHRIQSLPLHTEPLRNPQNRRLRPQQGSQDDSVPDGYEKFRGDECRV